MRKVYRETRKTIASVSAKMEESVSGMKEIQSYSREGETRTRIQTSQPEQHGSKRTSRTSNVSLLASSKHIHSHR